MAHWTTNPKVSFEVNVRLNEDEARALDALAGYGDDAFIHAFYERLGKAYMESHEAGLRSLLQSVRLFMPPQLKAIDEARKVVGLVGLS